MPHHRLSGSVALGTVDVMIKFSSNSEKVLSRLEIRKATLKGKGERGIQQASLFLEAKISEKISLDQLAPPLKEATIRRKGSSRVLFDKGYLLQQIDHKVYGMRAEVGVFDGKEKRAYIALVHEWGYPEGNIPERSFMRSALEENRKGLKKIFAKAAK